MNRLILLFLMYFWMPASFAQGVTIPQQLFVQQEQAASLPLVGVAGASPSDPAWLLNYAPNTTQAQIAQIAADAAAFNWTPQPLPNVPGFLVAAITTPGVTVQDIQVCGLVAQIVQGGGTNAQLKAIWPVLSPYATHPTQIVALAAKYYFPVQ